MSVRLRERVAKDAARRRRRPKGMSFGQSVSGSKPSSGASKRKRRKQKVARASRKKNR